MRFAALFLSLLAITSGVSADGKGEYKNPKAQKDAQIDRQNSIVVSRDSGVSIFSRSVTYSPATVNTTSQLAYDEVTITAGATGSGRSHGKFEIYLQSLNYTQAGTGKRADIASSEFEFAWRPFSIMQYVENSKDGAGVPIQNGFDANDTLCNEYQIRPGKSAFTFKFLQSKTVTADNGTAVLNTYEGTHSDGVFKVILKATGSETDDPKKIGDKRGKSVWIDNRFVSPTSIKFDIGIDVTKPKFGLNTNGTCGSAYQIAIRSWARSSQELYGRTTTQTTVNGTVVNNKQVTKLQRIQAGGSASPFGFFTWKDTASANYTTTPGGNVIGAGTANVIATNFQKIDNDEDDDKIRSNTKQAIHSFDIQRPTQLLWDPELGADSSDPDSTATTTDPTNPTTDPTTGGTGTTSSTGKNDATATGISVVAMAVVTIVGIAAQ